MTDFTDALVDAVTEVLEEHADDVHGADCKCGWRAQGFLLGDQHHAHQAQMVVAQLGIRSIVLRGGHYPDEGGPTVYGIAALEGLLSPERNET